MKKIMLLFSIIIICWLSTSCNYSISSKNKIEDSIRIYVLREWHHFSSNGGNHHEKIDSFQILRYEKISMKEILDKYIESEKIGEQGILKSITYYLKTTDTEHRSAMLKMDSSYYKKYTKNIDSLNSIISTIDTSNKNCYLSMAAYEISETDGTYNRKGWFYLDNSLHVCWSENIK